MFIVIPALHSAYLSLKKKKEEKWKTKSWKGIFLLGPCADRISGEEMIDPRQRYRAGERADARAVI
jgi:hypothetical protein